MQKNIAFCWRILVFVMYLSQKQLLTEPDRWLLFFNNAVFCASTYCYIVVSQK